MEISLICESEELWWTGAIALGMKYAYERGADYFIWLNDDCIVQAGVINNLVSFSYPDRIVGAQGYEENQAQKLSFGGKKFHWLSPLSYELEEVEPGKIAKCDMLSGNLVCLTRQVIARCGYPDSKRFPHYGGDTVYLETAKRNGFELFLDSRKAVLNIVPSAASSTNTSNWFVAKGRAFDILKLVKKPQSSLYWSLYLELSKSQLGAMGYLVFIVRYVPQILRVLMITILRCLLTEKVRMRLSRAKRQAITSDSSRPAA